MVSAGTFCCTNRIRPNEIIHFLDKSHKVAVYVSKVKKEKTKLACSHENLGRASCFFTKNVGYKISVTPRGRGHQLWASNQQFQSIISTAIMRGMTSMLV